MDGQIIVTPEVLLAKSEEVTTEINAMDLCIQELGNLIRKTETFWIGEAGDLHRSLFNKQKNDIDIIFRRLREHPKDLITMANVYSEAEIEAKAQAEQLAGDVIS